MANLLGKTTYHCKPVTSYEIFLQGITLINFSLHSPGKLLAFKTHFPKPSTIVSLVLKDHLYPRTTYVECSSCRRVDSEDPDERVHILVDCVVVFHHSTMRRVVIIISS